MKQTDWKHPGTTMSPAMTISLQGKPNNAPALQALVKEAPLEWKARPLETVDIDWGGKGTGHDECTKDGEQCYRFALLSWALFEDLVKAERYGLQGVDIIKQWSSKNKVFKGNNAPLEAAWSICSMARAAELFKHHNKLPKVKEAWRLVEPLFYVWLDKVIMPVLKTEALWRWPVMGNWHYSIICARMQIAILREDPKDWDWCIMKYKEIFDLSIGNKCGCSWFTAETKRDVTHAMFLIGGVVQAAEIAWHQGDTSLWNDRLHCVLENHAAIMLKEVPLGITKEEIKTPYGLWVEPVFEIGRHHFTQRRKMKTPKVDALMAKTGPERVTFHWGAGTLTHR